ncbi:MAG: type VI secretion system-associated FHA domain protein TagH [Proteobacteria bacterium]|nr:type VI secretion system-associated FHA domain protein TagH [Pseudomonadota bacterium]
MALILRAVSLDDQPLTQPITALFGTRGGTIGRTDQTTMALPDPERHISRRQAEIAPAERGYRISNIGTANPILVRGQALACGESTSLAAGDQLRIGGYLLEVADDAAADGAETIVRSGAGNVARPAGAIGDDPFAGLFGAIGPKGLASAPPPMPAAPSPPPLAAGSFDPFAPPPPAAAPSPASGAMPSGAFGDLVPMDDASSLDQLFGLGGGGAADPLRGFEASLAAPPAPSAGSGASGLSTDPLAMFDPLGAAAAPIAPTVSDHAPALHAAYVAPPSPPPARDAPPAPPRSASPEPLWQAFCDGAGVAGELRGDAGPETMRLVGQLLRAAVDGTLQLVALRAATKQELHADVTVIQARNNNPLKFSPDPQSALEQLLRPPLRGFLDGPAAMRDAMSDLLGHSIGTMAGMRAALEGVLDRFAPEALEAQLVSKSVLDNVLPINRKARLWDLYRVHAAGIRGEVQDDFHALFGRAFVAAYEQQLARLRSASASA